MAGQWCVEATWDHVENPDQYFETLAEAWAYIRTFQSQMDEDTVLGITIYRVEEE
jgi:hypothetical protein